MMALNLFQLDRYELYLIKIDLFGTSSSSFALTLKIGFLSFSLASSLLLLFPSSYWECFAGEFSWPCCSFSLHKVQSLLGSSSDFLLVAVAYSVKLFSKDAFEFWVMQCEFGRGWSIVKPCLIVFLWISFEKNTFPVFFAHCKDSYRIFWSFTFSDNVVEIINLQYSLSTSSMMYHLCFHWSQTLCKQIKSSPSSTYSLSCS